MATRRILIPFLYALALLTVLALVLLLVRIPLTEVIATRIMASAGLDHAVVHIQRLNTRELVVTNLDFTRSSSGATSRIEGRDIRIDYSITQLVNGEVDRISIKGLLLRHENTADTTSEPLDQAMLMQQMNTDWRRLVPFNTLSIDRVALEGAGFGPLEHTAHRLMMHKTGAAIETRLEYLAAPTGGRVLTTTLNGNTLMINLDVVGKPETPALHATVKTSADAIDIHWHLLPTELKAWLEPFVHLADIGSPSAVNGALNVEIADTGLIRAKLSADSKSYSIAGYRLLRPAINLTAQANPASQDRRLDILPGSSVRFAGIESDTLTIGNSVLNLLASYTNPDDHWSADGTASMSRLPVGYTDYAFVLKDIQNHLHADADDVSLNTVFSPEKLPGKFTVDASHNTASATGAAVLTMTQPIDLDGEESHLAQLLTTWPFPFDLVSGALRLNGSASWSGGALHKLSADIQLEDIGGNYNELLFSGLNYQQQLDLWPAYKSQRPGVLSLEHVDAGVAIENLSARIGVTTSVYGGMPKLVINGLIGHLFDGEIIGDPFVYDLNTPGNSLTIHALGIDLAEVVATQQFGDLEVSGRIDGILPVELNPYGVFINNGSLHNATPEGVIRYRPAAAGGLDQNPLTGIALKALSDFHYDKLNARANFVPDGTLTLGFELNGTSPPLQTSRPVHLNINTEQNLLSLLKSIRYVDGLNQGLDKSVREMYQRQTKN